ncbi:MAG: hypothetical protein R3B09_24405 [Nannocystaceae bacterium]
MHRPWSPPLVLALWILGALLLCLAVLDWTTYDLTTLETAYSTWRRHKRIGPDYFEDPWTARYWVTLISGARHGEAMAAAAALSGIAALVAAWLADLRPWVARGSLAIATATSAGIAAVAAAARFELHASVLAVTTLTRPSGPRLRWLTPDFWSLIDLGRISELEAAVGLLALLTPCLALAYLRVTRERAAASVSVLGMITAFLILETWFFAERPALEGWAEFVQFGRLVLVGAAVLCLTISRTMSRRPRLLPAIALFAAGVAAYVATEPHRRTIDTYYPRLDPGFFSLDYHWLPRPELLDPPRAPACARVSSLPWGQVALRVDDSGAVVVDAEGGRAALREGAPTPALSAPSKMWERADLDHWYRHRDEDARPYPSEVWLLIDRRVAPSALAELIDRLPQRIDRVLAVGALTDTIPSADGPIETWTLCPFAEIDRDAIQILARGEVTWGDLLDRYRGGILRHEATASGEAWYLEGLGKYYHSSAE